MLKNDLVGGAAQMQTAKMLKSYADATLNINSFKEAMGVVQRHVATIEPSLAAMIQSTSDVTSEAMQNAILESSVEVMKKVCQRMATASTAMEKDTHNVIQIVESATIDEENLESVGVQVNKCLATNAATQFRKAYREWELSRGMASEIQKKLGVDDAFASYAECANLLGADAAVLQQAARLQACCVTAQALFGPETKGHTRHSMLTLAHTAVTQKIKATLPTNYAKLLSEGLATEATSAAAAKASALSDVRPIKKVKVEGA